MDAEKRKIILKITEKANTDEAFREKLLNSTDKVLKEEGVELPKNMKVTVHENTKQTFYYVVPFLKNSNVKTLKDLPVKPSQQEVALWVMYQVQENTEFKEKLLKNPKEVLLEKGAQIPKDVEVHVIEDKEHDRHFVLPRMLKSGESLDITELEQVAGGKQQQANNPAGGQQQSSDQGENCGPCGY